MSKASAGKTGSFSGGDKVEVLSSEEGFSDAWATATCVGQAKGNNWLVEYSKFVDGDGKLLREKVRHRPPPARPGSDLAASVNSGPARVVTRRPKWRS